MKIVKWFIKYFWFFIIYRIFLFALVVNVVYIPGDERLVYCIKMGIFLFALVLAWFWERIFVFSAFAEEKKSLIYFYDKAEKDCDYWKESYFELLNKYRNLKGKHERATKRISWLKETRS